jgi:hypothetical protein
MKLDNYYSIKQDKLNTILCREEFTWNEKKRKNVRSYEESYYPNLEQALLSYMRKTVDANEDVASVLRQISESEQRVINALNTKQ